jgi:transposase
VAAPPRAAGIEAATWSAKVLRQFLAVKYGLKRSARSALRVLHGFGLVWKRPKRLLLKADAAKRAAFVEQYRTAVAEMERRNGRLFFVDEALFRADGDLRGLWVPQGEEALVPSSSPGRGEKANYYGGVCLETGDVIGGEFTGNSTAAMSVAFLQGLRTQYAGPLTVIWDNGPAHHGPALREYLQTPDLDLTLLALPAYSPDYNPAELVWKWLREEVTANTCFGTAAKVAAAVGQFFEEIDDRKAEVRQRCRSELQTAAFPETAKHPARRARKLQLRRERALNTALAM